MQTTLCDLNKFLGNVMLSMFPLIKCQVFMISRTENSPQGPAQSPERRFYKYLAFIEVTISSRLYGLQVNVLTQAYRYMGGVWYRPLNY